MGEDSKVSTTSLPADWRAELGGAGCRSLSCLVSGRGTLERRRPHLELSEGLPCSREGRLSMVLKLGLIEMESPCCQYSVRTEWRRRAERCSVPRGRLDSISPHFQS